MIAPVYFSKPGVICGAGSSLEQLWQSCLTGNQSGIKKVESVSGKSFFVSKIDDSKLAKTNARFDMRLIQIEDAALKQIENEIYDVISKYGKNRIATCVGSCDNGTQLSIAAHKYFVENNSFPNNYSLEMQGADYVATYIAEKYGICSAILAFSTACSSSAVAIIKAAQLLISDIADAVIVGGVDVVSDTVLLGFDSLEAISDKITNPFSVNRNGITLGEGAAFFVMTKEKIDNSNILLFGYGESSDAYHMTSPNPSGVGASFAMKEALKKASLSPSQIDYVNLHGTGTKFNDAMESKAVSSVFENCNVPVSSTKSFTGHTLGAAGALEAAICYNTIVQNSNKTKNEIMLPLQVWDSEKDCDIADINIISKDNCISDKNAINYCMSNSFAFGGSNVSLILGRSI